MTEHQAKEAKTATKASVEVDGDQNTELQTTASASGTPGSAAGVSSPKARKKAKKVIFDGIANILASFNNTMVTITDVQGATLAWSSAASCGYRGSRKSTPYAAGEAGLKAASIVMEKFGMKNVHVKVKGPGPGRESAIRSLHTAGLKVLSITDVTGIPFNGCRDPKKRRV
ncbi:MAG: rpsK [Gammaproteobacteria bacterium]|jgi:small subunit ribosomal protein S11|nr:rpsK [Gammaproteobacteria bacterium]